MPPIVWLFIRRVLVKVHLFVRRLLLDSVQLFMQPVKEKSEELLRVLLPVSCELRGHLGYLTFELWGCNRGFVALLYFLYKVEVRFSYARFLAFDLWFLQASQEEVSKLRCCKDALQYRIPTKTVVIKWMIHEASVSDVSEAGWGSTLFLRELHRWC